MNLPENTFIFIMAGGSGERFWPLSRKTTPKQLLRLFSDESLLGETVNRVQSMVPAEQLFILTNAAQVGPTQKALPDFPPAQIIGEPAKRDTAPAAALATAFAHRQDPNATVILLPADQLIKNVEAFQQNLADVATRASEGKSLLTLAIEPKYASTGFGYLELSDKTYTGPAATDIYTVSRFVEKPDLATAESYLAAGNFAWNAGMFAWSSKAFLEIADQHTPELSAFIRDFPQGDPTEYLNEAFVTLPKISVDYAIMEKAAAVEAAKATFDWDDVGAWTALPAHLDNDEQQNSIRGKATTLDAQGNILFSSGRHIAVCGANDLVVVETEDAVLVCHKDQVQNIKKLLPDLPEELL
ncbi:MAG: NTP transferase domain-containing protein [Gammaproteobacteria bacterium]|nr:NTP transferase domain-containing protein [Gammaproteobacteria bacterium]